MFDALDALDRDYRSRGVAVIAVTVDERRGDADRFLKARTYKVRVVFDPHARAFDAFGGSGVPVAYLIDRRGVVRYVHEGDADAPDATYRRQIDALLAEIR